MNPSASRALQHLTGKNSLEDVTVEELQKIITTQPYAAVPQFFLARKLKDTDSDQYLPQLQKTALYFPNPFWLNYMLNDGAKPKEKSVTQAVHEPATATLTEDLVEAQDILRESATQSQEVVGSEIPQQEQIRTAAEEVDIVQEENIISQEITEPGVVEEISTKENIAEQFPAPQPVSEEAQPAAVEEAVDTAPVTTETSHGEQQPIGEALVEEDHTPILTHEIEPNTVSEGVGDVAFNSEAPLDTERTVVEEELQPASAEEATQDTTPAVESTNQLVQEEALVEEQPAAELIHQEQLNTVSEGVADVAYNSEDQPAETLQQADPAPDEPGQRPDEEVYDVRAGETEAAEHQAAEEEPAEADEHDRMFQNIKAMLDATAAEANADTSHIALPIDPYHTIDYFASQGIKLELDANPQDELGKHLRKFTQWLKHMKKLGPEDSIPTSPGAETEAEIQQIADSSNTIKEVVTEAMAQVLEKQGKTGKAIELYNKLSFLYPHKTPYFADQIKRLKGV